MTGSLDHHDQLQVVAILLAAGSGSRSGQEVNKIFFPLAGVTVLERAVSGLLS
ncbi:MAG TPA: 2-C-methyl-D-erythritol 4-phosphate cytidylyltransferase, partial [Clostridia bacterium]|nr:2-C-methyl-D-erythritol 4-phosphate cytidylyltransferase [Clostridia bacterium]